MPEGRIKKLISDRGFGFIEGDQGELFFHHSEVSDTTFEELSEGQTVEYEVGQGRKGVVDGGKDGERAGALQRLGQPCGGHGSHEGGEPFITRGDLDDVGSGRSGTTGRDSRGGGEAST